MDNKHISRDAIVNNNKNIVVGRKCSGFYWIKRTYSLNVQGSSCAHILAIMEKRVLILGN